MGHGVQGRSRSAPLDARGRHVDRHHAAGAGHPEPPADPRPAARGARARSASWPRRSAWSSPPCPTSCACCATSAWSTGSRRGRSISYALYDEHVAELLDQAIYHAEHLRLGAPDRPADLG